MSLHDHSLLVFAFYPLSRDMKPGQQEADQDLAQASTTRIRGELNPWKSRLVVNGDGNLARLLAALAPAC
jgi:hypothetical protein